MATVVEQSQTDSQIAHIAIGSILFLHHHGGEPPHTGKNPLAP